jgi:Tfp pilus assembly protein PilX
VQTSESSVSKPDRRQTPRTKLAEIAYIGMGPENGGLVLDVSDGGLSFHSVAPVQPAETIRFLLSSRGQSRIEGAGEVVWTNEMRTVCGLRFTSLSSGAREYLNNWTNQSRMSAPAPEEAESTAPPAVPLTEESLAFLHSQSVTGAEPLFAIPPAEEFYLSEPTGKPLWTRQLLLWVVLGLLGISLLGSVYLYGLRVGQSQIKSMARPAAESESQTEPTISTPSPVPASSVATDASPAPTVASSIPNVATSAPSTTLVNVPKTDDATASAIQRPATEGNGAAASDPHAQQAAEVRKSEIAAAMAFLNGDNGHRDSSKAVHLLWAAVANGNSEAEVILAGLYLRGDGVAKNCEQGRVLLNAATKSGNAQAKVKLDELNANGCP